MANLVVVHGVEINELFHRGERVVTFDMVASVHGLSIDTVRDSYKRNARHFIDGKHTLLIEGQELQSLKEAGGFPASVNSLRVFSEQGYYLLVKPMRDDLSWEIQGEMAEAYFRAIHQIPEAPKPLALPDRILCLKAFLELGENFGLIDDYTRIIARETIQNGMREISSPYGQYLELPSPSMKERYFTVEDLRGEFSDIKGKVWMENRGTFGKVVRTAIQAADPKCQPIKVNKFVNGAEREVNGWPIGFRDIAIEAIRNYAKKLEAKVN